MQACDAVLLMIMIDAVQRQHQRFNWIGAFWGSLAAPSSISSKFDV